MEGVIAGPLLASQDGGLAKSVAHDSPALARQILTSIVQEIVVIDAFSSGIQIHILFQKRRSEVHIVLDFKGIGRTQALECLVLSDLIERNLLKRALRHYLTVAVDLSNDKCKSIELSEALGWDLNFSGTLLIDVHKVGDAVGGHDHFFVLAGEIALDLLEEGTASRGQRSGKRAEAHLLSSAPVVGALREVLLAQVFDSNGHVVVRQDA